MNYTVHVLFTDDMTSQFNAIKRPYIIDSRVHIDHSQVDYSIIPFDKIKMYTVKMEASK